MIFMRNKWAVMIDVNNVCGHSCIYCCKHVGHLRKDQLFQIDIPLFEKIVDSLANWENKIGLTGGDPLTHPEFPKLCSIVKAKIPKHKAIIFTSSKVLLEKYKDIIDDTFSEVYVNYHEPNQKSICNHQPLLLAVGDMVPSKEIIDALVEQCWCNKMWSPIVGPRGAFFCDCAAGLDLALNMDGGWKIEPNWWNRGYDDQIKKYCKLCGMCLPYPSQKQDDTVEKISSGLYNKFKEAGLVNLDNMEVIDKKLTYCEIINNLEDWEPWHNRQDRTSGEGPEYCNES